MNPIAKYFSRMLNCVRGRKQQDEITNAHLTSKADVQAARRRNEQASRELSGTFQELISELDTTSTAAHCASATPAKYHINRIAKG